MRIIWAISAAYLVTTSASAQEVDRAYWRGEFTRLCLNEIDSNPNMMEALLEVYKTAQSFCGCGADVMAKTITPAESEFIRARKKLRDDTYLRWRNALKVCGLPEE